MRTLLLVLAATGACARPWHLGDCLMLCKNRGGVPDDCRTQCNALLAMRATLIQRKKDAYELAGKEAAAQRRRMELYSRNRTLIRRSHQVPWVGMSNKRICSDPDVGLASGLPTDPLRNPQAVNITLGRTWRYYSIIDCTPSGSTGQRFCMLAKSGVHTAFTVYASSRDGLDFGSRFHHLEYNSSAEPSTTLNHNLAVLRPSKDTDDYILIGGMQDYGLPSNKREWLRLGGSGWIPIPAQEKASSGVRIIRGRGWPIDCTGRIKSRKGICFLNQSQTPRKHPLLDWPMWPKVVIHGTDPAHCIDRRPERTGYPAVSGCEFDGRLSLVQNHLGRYLLYARANLAEHALMGGRAVQVSSSKDAEHWEPWAPVFMLGLPVDEADIYFFLVSQNPVDAKSLIALFPLSQPPDACIAMAFSINGVTFSRPYMLQRSSLGWRTSEADGSGPVEWRVEDHPVAGIFLAKGTSPESDEVHFYIHHGVHGTSFADQSRSHVVRYSMAAQELKRFTDDGLHSLQVHPDVRWLLRQQRRMAKARSRQGASPSVTGAGGLTASQEDSIPGG